MAYRLISAAVYITVVAGTLVDPAGAQPIELHPSGATAGRSEVTAPDTRAPVSAALPIPPSRPEASASRFLGTARQVLTAGRVGEAEEALERAETRLLQSSARPLPNRSPAGERAVREIDIARRAVASGDREGALRAIDNALAAEALAAHPKSLAAPSGPVAPVPRAPPPPMVTYGALAGHWQLEGPRYVWVPPETVLRPVEYRPLIQSRYVYVWREGRWVWVPAYCGGD
jgi:hypothetical protein